MAGGREVPIVRLTSNRFWSEDFHFSIFTVRHNPASYPFLYCRNFWKIIYILSGGGEEVIDGTAYELEPDTLFVIHPDDVTRFDIHGSSEIEICNIIFLPELIEFGSPLLAAHPEFMRIFEPRRKEFDPEHHRCITGRSNQTTLATASFLEETQKPFWLRYVLVPGYTDFEADIRSLGEHFAGYEQLKRVEILPYHTLGRHKYEPLGLTYPLEGVKENTPEQLQKARQLFSEYFKEVYIN